MKFTLEYGPIIAFFAAYKLYGLMIATGVIIVATLITTALHYQREKKVPALPLTTAIIVTIFGGLTLIIGDESFIKTKPTIINALLGGALLIGLAFKKSLLKSVMSQAFELTEEGWHKLTVRYGIFFLILGVLNEIIWRTQTTDTWVNFKLFGILAITMVFTLTQIPLMKRCMIEDETDASKPDS